MLGLLLVIPNFDLSSCEDANGNEKWKKKELEIAAPTLPRIRVAVG